MIESTGKENNRSLPYSVWPVQALRRLETKGAESFGISLYELMLRAGGSAFELIRRQWPQARHWLILCGHGNNGGDGYVVARLAQAAGFQVTLLACDSERPLPEEAQAARDDWLAAGGEVHDAEAAWPERVEIIVDALLGTGLDRAPEKNYARLIEKANRHAAPVFSIDMPSGLVAANGTTPGAVIEAAATLALIALKLGQITGKARDYVGQLYYHGLGLEPWLSGQKAPLARYDAQALIRWLQPRRPTSHKGDQGRLLVVGGDRGTAGAVRMAAEAALRTGAVRMAAEAALRTGAGLVRVLTRKDNIVPVLAARPEIMVDELTDEALQQALDWADAIVIGPGLGQKAWGKKALQRVENSQKPILWDADALNLLAFHPDKRQNRIITPHPGEAARLLNISTTEIESDRLLAAQRLVKRYGGVVVLKGAGSLIANESGDMAFAAVGNAGMASGGMGDVLSGIIGALCGQKLTLYDAACAGCVAHGAAADAVAARFGTRGMLATDLFSELFRFVNPEKLNNKA